MICTRLRSVFLLDKCTWIFQVCNICACSPKKTYQKAEILHIWKIQVFILYSNNCIFMFEALLSTIFFGLNLTWIYLLCQGPSCITPIHGLIIPWVSLGFFHPRWAPTLPVGGGRLDPTYDGNSRGPWSGLHEKPLVSPNKAGYGWWFVRNPASTSWVW